MLAQMGVSSTCNTCLCCKLARIGSICQSFEASGHLDMAMAVSGSCICDILRPSLAGRSRWQYHGTQKALCSPQHSLKVIRQSVFNLQISTVSAVQLEITVTICDKRWDVVTQHWHIPSWAWHPALLLASFEGKEFLPSIAHFNKINKSIRRVLFCVLCITFVSAHGWNGSSHDMGGLWSLRYPPRRAQSGRSGRANWGVPPDTWIGSEKVIGIIGSPDR